MSSSLEPDEWDFRQIAPSCLPVAVEYEYLRSSDLRSEIQTWHLKPFCETGLAKDPWHIGILRRAQLLKVSVQSPLAKLDSLLENPDHENDTYQERLWRAFNAAARHIPKAEVFPGSVGQAIGSLFASVDEVAIIEPALASLSDDVPRRLKESHSDRICLRFDRFPESWLKIAAGPGGENYLEKRSLPESPRGEALWESINPIDYTEVLELEPLVHLHEFIINWGHPRRRILECFRKWLDQAHPDSRPGVRRRDGWLKRLSAYRLKRVAGLTYQEAISLVAGRQQERPGAPVDALPVSQTQSEWSRMVSAAASALRGNFIRSIREDFNDLTATPTPNSPHMPGAVFARSLTRYEKRRVNEVGSENRRKRPAK